MNHIPSPAPQTSDDLLEHAIKRVGADKAPRITPADIEANIVSEHYFTAAQGAYMADIAAVLKAYPGKIMSIQDATPNASPLSLLTFCVITLQNGFTVTGESACASPENFNAVIGRKIARENAINKVWPLMGYELRSKLAGGQA